MTTAKIAGRDHFVVLTDVRQDRLDAAVREFQELRSPARQSFATLRAKKIRGRTGTQVRRAQLTVTSVIHCGYEPKHQIGRADHGDKRTGHCYINNKGFRRIATDGFAIVSVSSIEAHTLPQVMVPARRFQVRVVRRVLRQADRLTSASIVIDGHHDLT